LLLLRLLHALALLLAFLLDSSHCMLLGLPLLVLLLLLLLLLSFLFCPLDFLTILLWCLLSCVELIQFAWLQKPAKDLQPARALEEVQMNPTYTR
jgi:hypothetical protein